MTCAVYVNLDGTLTENNVDYEQIYDQALEQAGIDGVSDTYESYTDRFFKYFQNGWTFPRRQAMLDVLNEHNIDDVGLTDAFAAAWEDLEAAQTTMRPETAQVIESLAARYPVGIITNGTSRLQRQKLEDAGLMDHLDAVVISSEIGKTKPHSGFFEQAKNTIEADTYVAVSHDLRRDILPAKRADMQTVWIGSSDPETDNQKLQQLVDTRITDLDDLVDAVNQLCEQ